MSEKNKGGRPAHHEGEVKKAAIAVRTAPSVRDALKRAAEQSGRSVTQEVEARLAASLAHDAGKRSPETEQLLTRFAVEIAGIEDMTGRKWHRHRETTGAVLEMFATKPQHWIRTDDPNDDEAVQAAWGKLIGIRGQQADAIDALKALGVTSAQMRLQSPLTAATMSNTPSGNVFQDLLAATSGRWRERHQLESLDLPDNIRHALLTMLDHLEHLDGLEREAEQAYTDAMRPYVDAEQTGRKRYREHRAKVAQEHLDRGEMPDLVDWLMGKQ